MFDAAFCRGDWAEMHRILDEMKESN